MNILDIIFAIPLLWALYRGFRKGLIYMIASLTALLLGVLGGMMAFGFIGVFIGPTILAVAYSLMIEWSSTKEKKA